MTAPLPVGVQFTVAFDKPSYKLGVGGAPGDLVTATYVLTGADNVPGTSVLVPAGGSAQLDGPTITAVVQGPVTFTTDPITHTVVFNAPTLGTTVFTQSATNPHVWTGNAKA